MSRKKDNLTNYNMNRTRVIRVDLELHNEFKKIIEAYKKQNDGREISYTQASYIFWRNYKRGYDGFGGIG